MEMTAQICQRVSRIIVGPEGERQLFAGKRLARLKRKTGHQPPQALALRQIRARFSGFEANITQENDAKRGCSRFHRRFPL